MYGSRTNLADIIKSHYIQSIVASILKIIGTMDLIGNPLELLINLGKGIFNAIYLPINKLRKGKGLSASGESLVKSTYIDK